MKRSCDGSVAPERLVTVMRPESTVNSLLNTNVRCGVIDASFTVKSIAVAVRLAVDELPLAWWLGIVHRPVAAS